MSYLLLVYGLSWYLGSIYDIYNIDININIRFYWNQMNPDDNNVE